MSRLRIAIVYDDVIRPDTTGTHCLRALRMMHDVQQFKPDQLKELSPGAFDLFLNIDDGLRYRFPDTLRPSAWWVIDTHLDSEWAIQKGRDFDRVFAAQRDGTMHLNSAGIIAHWLPLACAPDVHRPHRDRIQRWDVCFIGNCESANRQRLLSLIHDRFPHSFAGQRYFDDFAATYSSAKIGFNRSIKNDINMRVFETMACGPLLMTNDLRENGQEELFTSDEHFVTYVGDEELLDKLRFYLAHHEARERIALAGHQNVIARHTYQHRMASLIDAMNLERASSSVLSAVVREPCTHADTKSSDDLTGSENRQTVQPDSDMSVPVTSVKTGLIDEVDFVIKTFLRPKALLRLLQSIIRHYPNAQITVADDGGLRAASDENSLACGHFIDEHPQVVFYSMAFGAGVTAGRNLLVDQTSRPFLLFMDDDFCVTDETKVERLLDRIKVDSQLGVVAGACVDIVDSARFPRQSGGVLSLEGDTLEIRMGEWLDAAAGLRSYVPQFFLVRRVLFNEVRWDGAIGAEHYDLLLQLRNTDWKIAQDVSVCVDHYPQTETLPGYDRYRFDYAEAQQWLLQKWGLRAIIQNGQVVVQRSAKPKSITVSGMIEPAHHPLKDASYFEFSRPEVVELIPPDARRVLDIGCGTGRLGLRLKQRQSVSVVGIELHAAAAAIARTNLDEVIESDVEHGNVDFPAGRFDCIVCADVLEHLRHPEVVLEKVRRWLAPHGVLVISVPNARNHSVVSGLLDGNWTYESAGLLDEDHVRFFTRREIEKLLFRQQFQILKLNCIPGPGYSEWQAAGRQGRVKVGSLQIQGLSSQDAEEFFTYQFLVVAQRATLPGREPPSEFEDRGAPARPLLSSGTAPVRPAAEFGLTSIIIVTHNQVMFTKECVDSIRLRTDEPYELIFVDNGSTDATPQYLGSLAGVQLIRNTENRGFPAAVNQGLKRARGEYVLLLNNDTVMTTGWLHRLLMVLKRNPQVGLVGPCSNNVSGRQVIECTYSDMSSLDGFAWEWGKQHDGMIEETDRLIGFCLLLRKQVLAQIGELDERFGIGCFEDDDLCLRAIQAGWKAVIARDSFVHHYGGRTFAASGVDFAGLMHENQRKFQEKWQSVPTTPGRPDRQAKFGITSGPDGELMLTRPKPRLSLCMIVRDNESTIRPCLESIRPWVDEIIVVDTGSVDATPQICQELGAQVFHWPWRDDFSAARNQSLDHASGDWLFWMDSDDTITETCGRRLRELADGEHQPSIMGYVIQVHCPGPSSAGTEDVTAVDHIKLIRNRPDLRFEHRIHEQILPAIRRVGGEVAFTDLYVVHSGSDHSAEGRVRKLERDFKLLQRDLQERPDHPFVLFNLGMTHADAQQHVEAVDMLTRCLEVSQPHESHVRKAYALLISSLMQLRDYPHASLVCDRGRTLFPDDKELLFRNAMLMHELGHLEAAAQLYREVLTPSAERHFASIDVGLSGYKARHNLALVYEAMEQFSHAEHEWRAILNEHPTYQPAQLGLTECLIRGDGVGEANERIAQFLSDTETYAQGIRLSARLTERTNGVDAAIIVLRRGLESCSVNLDLLRELARLLHAINSHGEALEILEQLTRLAPDDASAWHNRGVVLSVLHRDDDAQLAFQRAETLRQVSPSIV